MRSASHCSHCLNLQGLDLLGICTSNVQNHIPLWQILSGIKLTDLAVQYCVLKPGDANKKFLMTLYARCLTIKEIKCVYCTCEEFTSDDELTLSLNNFCAPICCSSSTMVQDVINSCN